LIDKLVANGAITESVAPLIDVVSILKFFETELGRTALDKNNLVWREWPFTFAFPASQWLEPKQLVSPHPRGGGLPSVARRAKEGHCEAQGRSNLSSIEHQASSNDFIIVQGIIDLLIKTPDGLVVIDFKTDDVSPDQLPHRAELYRRQLDLYAQAAESILGQKILGKWLYFLKLGRAIQV
jgi:ATP-dependent helicase/nuclease subunit A